MLSWVTDKNRWILFEYRYLNVLSWPTSLDFIVDLIIIGYCWNQANYQQELWYNSIMLWTFGTTLRTNTRLSAAFACRLPDDHNIKSTMHLRFIHIALYLSTLDSFLYCISSFLRRSKMLLHHNQLPLLRTDIKCLRQQYSIYIQHHIFILICNIFA